jgi:formylglycine-generating enzyme required for sulfatase activity
MRRSAVFILVLFAALVLDAGCRERTAASNATAQPFRVVSKSGVEMIALPGGRFTMGTSDATPDEAPPHQVSVSAFLMDKFEVTHEMFAAAQLPDPSHWQENPKTPVERVRWRDAKAYCNERSRLEKLTPCYNEKTTEWDCDYSANGYRLPTEAEWEYAARAGAGSYDLASPDKLRQYAWYADNAEQKTHPVGQKKANAWGLADMYGNVSEWCEDVFSPTYYKESPAVDPTGPPNPAGTDVKRVMRGGNWNAPADACRVTFRQGQRTGNTDACFATDYCGFRCVRRAGANELAQFRSGIK